MIQANELRIGNFIQYTTGEIGTVIAVNELDIAISLDREFIDSSEFDPIPITPEILEKAGFRTSRKRLEWTIVVNQELGSVLTVQCVNGVYSLSCFPVEFQYVHQLQNITHALTGTELNIQL